MITIGEEQRRMADMMRAYSMDGMNPFGEQAETLVLNVNNALVKYLLENPEGDLSNDICCQLYDLASVANKPMNAEQLNGFVTRSNKLLKLLIK